MSKLKQKLLAVFFSFFVLQTTNSQYTFVEKDGVVTIEAEHYTDNTGPWEEVEGRNALTAELQGIGFWGDTALAIKAKHAITRGMDSVIYISDRVEKFRWAYPGKSAQTLVTLKANPKSAVLFIYPKGALLPDGTKAREMRIGSFTPYITMRDNVWTLYKQTILFALKGKVQRVLYISGEEYPEGRDTMMISLIKSWGIDVVYKRDKASATEDALNVGAVLITERVRNENLGDRFKHLNKPVVVYKTGIMTEMGMVDSSPMWQKKEGQYGNAMMIRYGKWTDNLRYAIYFNQPGEYNLWMLGKSGGSGSNDECKVFFNVDSIKPSGNFFEVRFNHDISWTNTAFHKTPQNRKTPAKAVIHVDKPGWHNLYIVKGSEPEKLKNPNKPFRYPNWRVDKILLTQSALAPEGDGGLETANTNKELPLEFASAGDYLPVKIYSLENGWLEMECEDMEHHPYWEFRKEPEGFSGSGYLAWTGPDRQISVEDFGGNNDSAWIRQGPQEEWFIIRVYAPEDGTYNFNVRNYHKMKDGDNDVWFSFVGIRTHEPGSTVSKIGRLTDSHKDGNGFTWVDWGKPEVQLKKGINNIYMGGRSTGFGIDKIIFYKKGDEKAEKRLLQ